MARLDLIAKINAERQTVKSYSEKPIPDADWAYIKDAIVNTRTAFKLTPFRVVVVDRANQELVRDLQKAAWNQGSVGEAAKIVIFITAPRSEFANEEWIAMRLSVLYPALKTSIIRERAHRIAFYLDREEPFADEWARKQTYEALANGLIAATLVNVGTTAMEGFAPTAVHALLKNRDLIADEEAVALVCLFGYPKGPTAYAHWGTGKRVRDRFAAKFKTV